MGTIKINSVNRNTDRPLSFAKTRQGLLLMTDGLDRGLVWDGVTAAAYPIGITAPTSAPGIVLGVGGSMSAGEYSFYYRFVDFYGNVSDLSPGTTMEAEADGKKAAWTFATSGEARVVARELWRTLAGDNRVVYRVAVINDNTTTTYSEGYSDEYLQEQALNDPNTVMPLFEEPFGRPFANRYGVPPSHKAVVAIFQDRSFWAVDAVYEVGTVTLTNGSATVTGSGTDWKSGMGGRYLYIKDSAFTSPMLISSVDSATSLTLSSAVTGPSGTYQYSIRPAASERNKIYFSTADSPEGVPVTNVYTLQENTGDDDEITGLMPHGSYLYILKDRHIYRLSYVRQPEVDIAVHLHAFRGCFNQRCWGRVEGTAYLMDSIGPYRLLPSGEVEAIGASLNDFWTSSQIDFSKSKWFFVSVDLRQQTVRFCCSLVGQTRPQFAMCYQYRTQAWWFETYQWPFGASVSYERSGEQWMLWGASRNRWYRSYGYLDGTAGSGTVRGTVTSATANTLVDSTAIFPTDIDDVPIAIVAGTGAGQVRKIASRDSATQVTVTPSWTTVPDTTSVYQIGAIEVAYKGPVFTFLPVDVSSERSFRLWYVPLTDSVTLSLERYINYSATPESLPYDQPDVGKGYSFAANDTNVKLYLQKSRTSLAGLSEASGLVSVAIPDAMEDRSETSRWVQYRLSGYTGTEPIRVKAIELFGVEPMGS